MLLSETGASFLGFFFFFLLFAVIADFFVLSSGTKKAITPFPPTRLFMNPSAAPREKDKHTQDKKIVRLEDADSGSCPQYRNYCFLKCSYI